MTEDINDLLAVLSGTAKSAMFVMFLPILFPIYLWDCWSNEHEDREDQAQIEDVIR